MLAATKSLTADLSGLDPIETLLEETAEMFRASRVELVIFDRADAVESPVSFSLSDGQFTTSDLTDVTSAHLKGIVSNLGRPTAFNSTTSSGPLSSWFKSLDIDDALAAPLRSGAGDIGFFVASDREGVARSFGEADLELFSTLSFQIGTAFENDRLGQALRDLRKLEGELSQLAIHDALTGLPNRLGLSDHLDSLSSASALLFVDLDDFKLVNDTLGHASGDHLLGVVARRIGACLSDGDFAARLGGDEFAVCVHGGDSHSIAEEIVASISEPIQLGSDLVNVGCSIGIATCDNTMEVSDMLSRADLAMYAAKAKGKNRVELYSDQLGAETLERQQLRVDLRRAIASGDFEVHYQPIGFTNGISSLPIAAEALVRWNVDGELRSPAEFLPLAEEIGLVVGLDRWVYRQALRAFRNELSGLKWMSVNLSARHLHEDDAASWLEETTRLAGVDPSQIVLEVTETAAMIDIDASIHKLSQLRSLGFGIALDDFGTGYSSIAYLRRLPISILKIAQSFITDLGSSGDQTFVRAIVNLAHTLNLPVIAEGVETQVQLETIAALGCDLAQGYLIGLPAELGADPTRWPPRRDLQAAASNTPDFGDTARLQFAQP